MKYTLYRFFIGACMGVFVFLLGNPVGIVHAQDVYESSIVSITDDGHITMKPEEVKTIQLRVKNTGTATWVNDGAGYISLYTYEPKYRRSVFDPGTWLWFNQVKRISEKKIAPKEQATLSFELRAPKEEGVYKEVFQLASEDRAWVMGGKVELTIEVKKSTKVVETKETVVTNKETVEKSNAEIVAQTIAHARAKAGEALNVQVAVKNTGTNTWQGFGVLMPSTHIANTSPDFADTSWGDGHVAYAPQTIKPGEVGVLQFVMRAPKQRGSHKASFEIMTDQGIHTDTFIDISIDVTNGARDIAEDNDAEDTIAYIEEPLLRLGVLVVDEETNHEVYIRSNTGSMRIETIDGILLDEADKGQQVHAFYKNGLYTYDFGAEKKTSKSAIRFIPPSEDDILEVINFDRRLTRRATFADNTFRGILELHYNSDKDRTWLINEIHMEHYLYGLAETHNDSPYEYQKAIIIAARSYAYSHVLNDTKWKKEYFTMTAYSYDQVYSGYGQETRSPNIVRAVEETRGEVVTYDGAVIATPYFSRSDGRTRSWSEVWNGSRPWAVSVPVACEKGQKLLGHGVGMSARGAICLANEGMTGEEILKYFYTGIAIDKKWK